MKKQKKWRAFGKARQLARTLSLRSQEEWKTWARSPEKLEDIPISPQKVYRKRGWISWGDWLGTGNVASQLRQYRPFKEARAFIRSLNVEAFKHWTQSGTKPEDISTTPHLTYKNKGWVNWNDFLGAENINTKTIQFRPFQEARNFARSLKLTTQEA